MEHRSVEGKRRMSTSLTNTALSTNIADADTNLLLFQHAPPAAFEMIPRE